MIVDIIFSCAVVAGVAALWRNFRYDTDNPANKYLNRLPYVLRKPITCGLCVTFWVALAFTALFDPLVSWLPPTRFAFSETLQTILAFLSSWMALGTGSALMLYVLDTFLEVSHFYKHRAHGPKN